MHIIITGNPVDGFVYVGPFADSDAAIEAAETECCEDWWVAELEAPEADDSDGEE